VLCAIAGNAPRNNLAPFGDETPQPFDILRVDVNDLIRTELADLRATPSPLPGESHLIVASFFPVVQEAV
jgi:hypothetical protein